MTGKSVAIIGVGVGPATLTAQGAELIRQADVLLGAPRLVEAYATASQRVVAAYRPDAVAAAIERDAGTRYAVLVSGDVGFYSAAAGVYAALADYERRLVPGVSSVAYFFARCARPWQDAALVSCHGTTTDIVGPVRRHHWTFVLTGGNTAALATGLAAVRWADLPVWVGEDLGGPSERITATTVAGLRDQACSPLTVLLIENAAWDARARAGLPDDLFTRGEVPMTKAEVRAVSLARLAPHPSDTCYDIGCGTGSVTVELALAAYRGHVYAIDQQAGALDLTRTNCAAFKVGNVTVLHGHAPDALVGLPAPDVAFIGGSSGRLGDIVAALVDLNPAVRLVITAIALETVGAALQALTDAGFRVEATQLAVARTRAVGGLHLLQAQNPVTIIWGEGDGRRTTPRGGRGEASHDPAGQNGRLEADRPRESAGPGDDHPRLG
jgi:precorrin-6Y C5,15-methyltransferase (decarboxylating)